MPSILYAGSEGEFALFENELDTSIGADDKRRGGTVVDQGDQMFRAYPETINAWHHVRVFGYNTNHGNHRGRPFLTISNGDRDLVELRSTNYDDQDAFRYDVWVAGAAANDQNNTVWTVSEDFPHPDGGHLNHDIHIEITTVTNPNDTMTVRYYRNEVLRHTKVVTDPNGWGAPTSLLLEPKSQHDGEFPRMYYQDVIITDSLPTVGMELATLAPSAVGQYNDFTNDYTSINGPGYDPSTVIASESVGQKESWIFADPEFDLGDKVIYGICLTTVAQTDLGNIVNDFRPFLRIATFEYPHDALGANNVAPDAFTSVWTTNPYTNQPWTQADLKGLEAGVESI